MSVEQEIKDMDPQQYFEYIKSKKHESSDEFITNLQKVVESELSKAMVTGQNVVIRRLAYAMGVLERERKLIKEGIDTYVQREDIEDFIHYVKDKAVKIVEIELFPRSIPDELALKVKELKEKKLFDNFFILCTDYTDGIAKEVKKEERKRDPILFGTFEQKIDNMWDIHDRFYFIGDWEDEYCDLTLSKMVEIMAEKDKDIVKDVGIKNVSEEEVRSYINSLDEIENSGRFVQRKVKKSFFENVKTFFKRK